MATFIQNLNALIDQNAKNGVDANATRQQAQDYFNDRIKPSLDPKSLATAQSNWAKEVDYALGQNKAFQPKQDPKVTNSPQFQQRYKQFYDAGQPLDVAKKNAYEAAKNDLIPEKGLLGHAKDAGLSALKGAIAVPEAIVGLADIPTGGRVGKFLENEDGMVGFRPAEARQALDGLHTERYQKQQQDFSDADGIGAKLGQVAKNPTLLTNTITESAPLMLGGGVIGRGLTMALPKISALAAGAVGG